MSFKPKQRWMNRTAPELKAEEAKLDSSGLESSEDDSAPPLLSPVHDNSAISPSTSKPDDSLSSPSKMDDDSIPSPPPRIPKLTDSGKDSKPSISKEEEAASKAKVAAALSAIQLIKENTYLFTRSQDSRRKNKHTRMSCDCSPPSAEEKAQGIMGCGEDCLNRMLLVECTKCPCGSLCANRRMQQKTYSEVEPFDAGPKGVGLRAKRRLIRNDFVIEYVGEVLDAQQFRSRQKRYGKDETHKHHYFMGLQKDEVIDATVYGNISRFINHSCDPNAETQKWTVDGELRIGFFAIRTIEPGEEITFDYQFQRYGREAQVCLCGAANCRGFIGGQATEEEGQTNKEIAKEKKLKEKRRRAYMEDLAMEEDMKTLEKSGTLRTREDVLTFSRLMVRGVDFDSRMKLLGMAQHSEEQPLRLFLDYHGCKLIWSWLVDDEHMDTFSMLKLQRELLRLLSKLPIPHRNMLTESRILRIITRWAQTGPPVPSSPESKIDFAVKRVVQQLVDTVCNAGDAEPDCTPSGSSCSSSINGDDSNEENNPEYYAHLIQEESQRLLDKWSDLKEYFKIPKKTEAAKAARVGKIAERTYQIPNHSPLTPKVSKAVLDNAAAMSYNKTVLSRGQPVSSSTSYHSGRRAAAGHENPTSFSTTTRYVAPKKEYQEREKRKKRSHSGSPPPSARRRQSSPRWRGDSSSNEDPRVPSGVPGQISVRKRPSRFDRKSPVSKIKPLTKEERRRLFEESVKRGSHAVQDHFMTTDFAMDAAAVEMDLVSEQIDMLKNDNMVICSSPETSSPTSSGVATSTPTAAVYHAAPYNRYPPGTPLPALFVLDPNTNLYWWQDQASGTLVYQVSPDQVSQRLSVLRPETNPEMAKLLSVNADSRLTRGVQSLMQQHFWECARRAREIACPKRGFDAPPQELSEREKLKLARIHRGDWSKTPHFVYDMNTGLIHESAVPDTAEDSKVPKPSPAIVPPKQAVPVEEPAVKKKTESATSPSTSSASSSTVLNPSEQIRALEAQIRELQKQVEQKNAEVKKVEPTAPSPKPVPEPVVEPKPVPAPESKPDLGVATAVKAEPVTPSKTIKINIPSITSIALPKKSPVLPPNWKKAYDEEGNVYYYHTISRKTQWDLPVAEEEVMPEIIATASIPLPSEMPSVQDPAPSSSNSATVFSPVPAPVLAVPEQPSTSDYSMPADLPIKLEPTTIPLIEPFSSAILAVSGEKKLKPVEAVMPFIPVTAEPVVVKADSPSSSSFQPESTTADADTSSEVTRRQKEEFKTTISKYIVKCLHPYKKEDCKVGRIVSSDDFKHLARKLSHTIMEKELKRCNGRYEELKATENVRKKAKDYVKLYMKKIGPVYNRTTYPTS